MSRSFLIRPLTALLALSTLTACPEEPYEVPQGDGPHILVDLYHTELQNPEDHRMVKWNYNYQGVHGYSRLFDHLANYEYQWSSIRTMPLSAPRLEGYDALFINLVAQRFPDFTDDEVEVIKDYVRGGGGLLVIADHTNVYDHAQRVNRFLEPMGIEVTYHSSLDSGANSVSGLGWIAIDNLEDHPTNEGIDMISFQTGGVVSSEGATARTGPNGFGDFWIEDNAGYYGDWRFNDDGTEPRGDVPVVAAVEYGEGRVVVVADQNIYGDAYVHFADNFRHALNVFEWITQNDGTSEVPLRDTRPHGVNIGMDIKHNDYAGGNTSSASYYTFFVNLNRDQGVTGRGLLRYTGEEDAIVFPSPETDFSEAELETIKSYLGAGRKVVISMHAPELTSMNRRSTLQLLRELAPGFTLSDGTNTVTIGADDFVDDIQAELNTLSFDPIAGPLSIAANAAFPGVEDLSPGDLTSRTETTDGESVTVYDLSHVKVTSDWGEPLLQTTDGIDVARSMKIDGGELIVVMHDAVWRNRSMGGSEAKPPPAEGEDNVRLEYLFIDYLEVPVEGAEETE